MKQLIEFDNLSKYKNFHLEFEKGQLITQPNSRTTEHNKYWVTINLHIFGFKLQQYNYNI